MSANLMLTQNKKKGQSVISQWVYSRENTLKSMSINLIFVSLNETKFILYFHYKLT